MHHNALQQAQWEIKPKMDYEMEKMLIMNKTVFAIFLCLLEYHTVSLATWHANTKLYCNQRL